ncbi:MAG: oligosaccharide flippase family protein [Erysipelotrichaceae bacterium]|nr:oligosaccharide flippase family protein [Erysipelotrichaceae bacterium]
MKRKLINSFIILTSTTLISKIFSLINRMILSRLLNDEGMALYILVIPTLSLCITLAQFSIPSAVFRLISHPRYRNKKVIISALLICGCSCLLIVLSLLCFSRMIALNLLKQPQAIYPLLCMIPFIPLVGISGIMKNYYLGKENVGCLAIASILEESSRIIFSIVLITLLHDLDICFLVSIAILSMSIGELVSIIYLYFQLHRKINIRHHDIDYIKEHFIFKDIMNIALPLTGSRLLHSGYNFIEPIVLVNMLSRLGYAESIVQNDFAIMAGYVVSLLFTPTFFNNVILRMMLPQLNRDIAYSSYYSLRKHILYGLVACFIISLPFTLIFYFYGDICLKMMYDTTQGYDYLKYMCIPFTLCYLQTPLSATLQALGKNQEMFIMSGFEVTIEFICLIILTPRYAVLSVGIVMLIGQLSTLVFSSYYVYFEVYKKRMP